MMFLYNPYPPLLDFTELTSGNLRATAKGTQTNLILELMPCIYMDQTFFSVLSISELLPTPDIPAD